MPQMKYRIYELSARAVASYATEDDGEYAFHLSRAATEKCKAPAVLHEQDGNALFFQIMCVLRGDGYREPRGEKLITDLSDVIFYMSFEHIFDRRATQRKYIDRQRKAETMFRPEGVTLDFGSGARRFLAFERSASMSRNSRLSFIRADLYEEVRRRVMLDVRVGDCQLSKLYAYNGLMLSGGVRVEDVDIDRPHRVIVVDNPVQTVRQVRVITVEDDGTENSTRRYRRVEKEADVEVMSFDGEGLISWEYAKTIDNAYCGRHVHTSFQIRLPFVKGMLHQVDFKDFLTNAGTKTITDLWGVAHDVADVDVILTRSMFKGYGWLKDDGKSWEDYWAAFRRYRHALYITGVNKEKPEATTDLNYQLLNTLSMIDEEFRPSNLPYGWEHSPEKDTRLWLTKETELAYYNLCANERFRLDYFLSASEDSGQAREERERLLARCLKKNPLLLAEPVCAKELETQAEKILEDYSIGHLIVAGDNRYLSGDLLAFLTALLNPAEASTPEERMFLLRAMNRTFLDSECYVPGAAYEYEDTCTLLRNPHIAKNEELLVNVYSENDGIRERYLGHLTGVVMVGAEGLCAERLGGADYDGDMIRIIADPAVNECVLRNYSVLMRSYDVSSRDNLPLLQIPSAEPLIRNADDWRARFEAVSSTFASRVGQICNAALDRSVIAYNENSEERERRRCREETETLAILVGLEIDSAKSGVRPDLSEYLKERTVKRSAFLKYKELMEASGKRRAWYEPTHREKLKAFFEKTDWSKVSSNIERLPYLAEQLKRNTPRIKIKPASDKDLFIFAQDENWRERLDAGTLEAVSALLRDYTACLSRIRACRVPVAARQKMKDVERILYSRGQEELYDADELYALFQTLPPERISALLGAIREQSWQFMEEPERERFLSEWLSPEDFEEYYDLLSDFRHGGYRLLADLVMDVDRENTAVERKQLFRDSDSSAFTAMMRAYADGSFSKDYKDAVTEKCRELLGKIVKPSTAAPHVVALGRRDLLWELLPDQVERHVLEVRHAE